MITHGEVEITSTYNKNNNLSSVGKDITLNTKNFSNIIIRCLSFRELVIHEGEDSLRD